MSFKIGFTAETKHEEKRKVEKVSVQKETPIIKKSVVEVQLLVLKNSYKKIYKELVVTV